MAKRKYRSYNLFISILSLLIIGGCTVEQTYKTLVFFFDGVPPLEKNNQQSNATPQQLLANIDKEKPELRENEPPKLNLHQPYLDRKCELCHTPNRGLLMPMPGLCYKCHANYEQKFAFVHAPVQSGNCTKCHNQHLSELPKLLIREGQDICLYCHGNSMNADNKYHKDISDASCTLCHNPHGGKTRNFLRETVPSDFDGIAQIIDFASKRIYARIFVNTPGDIPAGKEIVIQNNDDNYKVVYMDKIDNNGRFFIDKLKKRSNYTIRLKGEEYDSVKLNIVNYKNDVLYDFGYSNKNKFSYNINLYDSLNNLLKIKKLMDSVTVVINKDNNSQLDSLRKGVNSNTNNAAPKTTSLINEEFATEFTDSLNNEDRHDFINSCELTYKNLYANKNANAYIYIIIRGNKTSISEARSKAKDIKDYLREKGIKGRRVYFAEINKKPTSDNTKYSKELKITIIVK